MNMKLNQLPDELLISDEIVSVISDGIKKIKNLPHL
jgi:hypothetical protein